MRKRGGLLHFCSLSYSHFIPSQPASLGSGYSHTCSCSHWVYFLELTSKDAIDGYEVLRGIESAVERASWGPLILSRLPPCDLSLLVTVTFLSKRSNFLQDDSQNHSGLLSLLLSGDGNYQQKDPKRGRAQVQLFWGQIQLPLHWGTMNGWQWTSDLPARRGEESLSSWGLGRQGRDPGIAVDRPA